MQHVLPYIALILLSAFLVLSKTFSPVWLLVIILVMLWPDRKRSRVRPVFLLTILFLLLSVVFSHFSLLAPFIIGIGLAYILTPIVNVLEAKRVPRSLAILLCLLPIIALFPMLIFLIISGLVDEMQRLIIRMPDLVQQSQLFFSTVIDKVSQIGIEIDPNILTNTITNHLNNIVTGIFTTISQIGKGIESLIIVIYNIIIIPLSAYLFLADRDRILSWFRNLFSRKDARRIEAFIQKLNTSLARFFRGQLTLMVVVGFIVGFTLWILGIKYYLLLGIIAGICNLIPNIGYILSFIPAIAIGLTSPDPFVNLIKIVAVYVGEQLIENVYLGPLIIGKASRLHPVIVMVALIIGGTTFGVWGVVLAIPVTIFVREFMNFFLHLNV
ncbi:MAG: AI-2E family transporter [candidate division WOR-3 bacterium]|nr:MAG: AI-2E family transporter [candidate division WOR-3 bacterium]